MMRFEAVTRLFPDLEPEELVGWIEQEWVRPENSGEEGWIFYEIDVARVRLIYDLRRELGASVETVPMLLSLLDQVYEMRRKMKALTEAVNAQPEEIRTAVFDALGRILGHPGA